MSDNLFARTKDHSEVAFTVVESLSVRTATETLAVMTVTDPEVVRTTPSRIDVFVAPETIYVTP